MELTITVIEGNTEINSQVEMHIQIDGKLSYVFSIRQLTKTFSVPLKSTLKMMLLDSNTAEMFGNVILDSSLIPPSKSFWLPLFKTPDKRVEKLPFKDLALMWVQLAPSTRSLNSIPEEDSVKSLHSYDDKTDTDCDHKNKNLTQRIVLLENQMKDLLNSSKETSQDMKSLRARNNYLEQELARTKIELDLRNKKIADVEAEVQRLKNNVKSIAIISRSQRKLSKSYKDCENGVRFEENKIVVDAAHFRSRSNLQFSNSNKITPVRNTKTKKSVCKPKESFSDSKKLLLTPVRSTKNR